MRKNKLTVDEARRINRRHNLARLINHLNDETVIAVARALKNLEPKQSEDTIQSLANEISIAALKFYQAPENRQFWTPFEMVAFLNQKINENIPIECVWNFTQPPLAAFKDRVVSLVARERSKK